MGLFVRKKLKPEDYYLTLEYVFDNKPQEDFSPEAFKFDHMFLMYVQLMCKGWFHDESFTASEVFKNSKVIDPKSLLSDPDPDDPLESFREYSVQKPLLNTQSKFDGYKRASWESSALARKWQATLESKGVGLNVFPSPQDASVNILQGSWALFDGETPLPIFGEVWRNKSGKEFIYWFFDAIVRTRKLMEMDEVHPSSAYYAPLIFQTAGYISETTFPSSMILMRDRMAEFGVDSVKKIPQLAFHHEKDYVVFTVIRQDGGFGARTDWSPETTRYGYIIDDSIPFDGENEIVPQLVNALPKVASILMDGFANWNSDESLSFQAEFFHDNFIDRGYEDRYHEIGYAVPGQAYGALQWRTIVTYQQLMALRYDEALMKNPDNVDIYRTGLSTVANIGIGAAAAHAVNSLYFGLSTHPAMADADSETKEMTTRILEYFSHVPFDRQDANAISNLALYKCLWGDYQEALTLVNRGIALFDEELDPSFITEISGGGPFYPIIIKWELLLTKARVLVLLKKPEKAKEPLTVLIQEAKALKFDGQELIDAQELLTTL